MKAFILLGFCLLAHDLLAVTYFGRIVDETGVGIPYATVYLKDNPVEGTATNADGYFEWHTKATQSDVCIVSFVGYEKLEIQLNAFTSSCTNDTTVCQKDKIPVVCLKEQPIVLSEMVVAGKKSRRNSKKNAISQELYKVYNRMQYDMPDIVTGCTVVSDVHVISKDEPWGMEQMVAYMVNIPGEGTKGRDSVQMQPQRCKRYIHQTVRDRADVLLSNDNLSRQMRNMTNELDSGVVVHKALWASGNIRYDFEQAMNDWRHWHIIYPNANEIIFSHEEKKNYLGIYQYQFFRNYIVDSKTYRVIRFNEELSVAFNIPFGYKLNTGELEVLNLLNVGENAFDKIRIKKGWANFTLNTEYQPVERISDAGKTTVFLFVKEKNLETETHIEGTKGEVIPIACKATQRVTHVQSAAKPLKNSQISKRVPREIVPIY